MTSLKWTITVFAGIVAAAIIGYIIVDFYLRGGRYGKR